MRKFFLGPQNAIQYISRVDKKAVTHLLKLNGALIGENCDIETGLMFHNCTDLHKLKIGRNCHIGKNCFFDLREKIEIGDNVVISMFTTFITHIDMNKSDLSSYCPTKAESIAIKDSCYFGVRSIVLMGVKIGESAFIAANSLVNNNVAPFTMMAGSPAKKIKDLPKQ